MPAHETQRRAFWLRARWVPAPCGATRWLPARPRRNLAGAIVAWFGTNTDVTAMRELQEQLETAN